MANVENRRSPRIANPPIAARMGVHKMKLLCLGDAGARIQTQHGLAIGERVVLRLDDPAFFIHGRVVHSRLVRVEAGPEGKVPVFEAGIDFSKADLTARIALEAVMARLLSCAGDGRMPVVSVEQAA